MQQLFIIKRVDGVQHVIGRLFQTVDGVFGVEDLLAEPGSERLGIPVFKDKGENAEKLLSWIMSFMPPVGNERLMQMLVATLGVDEFEPFEWLKLYKPGGRNVIGFCEKIPFECLVHCSDIPPQDFAKLDKPLYEYVDFDDDEPLFVRDFEDCTPPSYDSYGEYIDCYDDDCWDYFEDEEEDDDDEYDEEEPAPAALGDKRLCCSLPVFPENIPQESKAKDLKSFSKALETKDVEDLRTIHNTLCALAKLTVKDFAQPQDLEPLANSVRIPTAQLEKTTLAELVNMRGHLIVENSDVPNCYTKAHLDLFGLISRDIRATAYQQIGAA